jgi:hypothetical protein
MTAKDYLERYRQAQDKADRLKAKYTELVDAYGDISGPTYTECRPAGISKPTERKVERAQAVLEKWRRAQLDALEIRQTIYWLLEALPTNESEIMTRRYAWLQIWEQIEQETGYTHSNVFRIHRRALPLVQDLIDSGAIEEIQNDLDAYIKKYVNTWDRI